MVSQQLLEYIKQQLQQGVGVEQIKQSLIGAGWQEQDINDGFSSIITPSPSIPNTKVFSKTGGLMWKIIAVSVVGVGIIGGGIYFFSQGSFKSEEKSELTAEVKNTEVQEENTTEPITVPVESKWKTVTLSADGIAHHLYVDFDSGLTSAPSSGVYLEPAAALEADIALRGDGFDDVNCTDKDNVTLEINREPTSLQAFSKKYDTYYLYMENGALLNCVLDPVIPGMVFVVQSTKNKLFEVEISKLNKEMTEIELTYRPLENYVIRKPDEMFASATDYIKETYNAQSKITNLDEFKVWYNEFFTYHPYLDETLQIMSWQEARSKLLLDGLRLEDITGFKEVKDISNPNKIWVELTTKREVKEEMDSLGGSRDAFFLWRDNDRWRIR